MGNRNIIVAIDYFTKWAECKVVAAATAEELAGFFIQQLV